MDAELRVEHDHVCKDIHNDHSAKALLAFGFIFVVPSILAVCACACYTVFAALS